MRSIITNGIYEINQLLPATRDSLLVFYVFDFGKLQRSGLLCCDRFRNR
jgi:hypothetical protein